MGWKRYLVWTAMICTVSLGHCARLLPEMKRHLAFGKSCLSRNDVSGAVASADLMLLECVKVYVSSAGQTQSARSAVDQALGIWTASLDGQVRFEWVDSATTANVVVTFQQVLGENGLHYGGFAKWKRSVTRKDGVASWQLKASIQLRTMAPDGAPMSEAQVRHVALHEIGHVLGLDDSSIPGEVMSPLDLAQPVQNPHEAEIRTLMRFREEAHAIRARAMLHVLA